MTVSYLAHGVTLALAWFLIVNVAASTAAIVASRLLEQSDRSPAFWFLMRVAPAVASALFVAAVFLPSYWRYEPPDTGEGFDVTLTALAAGALVVVAVGVVRGTASWLRAQRRARAWIRDGRPFGVFAGVPAFAVDADVPVMALVGILRPRLIVTTSLVRALSDDELQTSIAHEIAHRRAWDNLKRLAIRMSPDVLGLTRTSRAMEQRWTSAAEQAADSRAGGGNPSMRCALASALVKVARLMPPGLEPHALEPISTLVDGVGDITARVARLLDDSAERAPRRLARARRWAVVAVFVAAVAVGYSASLVTVHEATETLVQLLP